MGKTESIIRRFPSFYPSRQTESNFYRFMDVFGSILDDVETDLLKVMRSHWVDTADNEGSRGFDTAQKGDLDKIFSLYLENLGGTSQLKQVDRRSGSQGLLDDAVYRERIKGLINVLKSGAATMEGIITIVAANLGIVGDDEAAVEARRKIRIAEFLPEAQVTDLGTKALLEEFVVTNPNVVPTTLDIRLEVVDLPQPLTNPRLVNLSTGQSVLYTGALNRDDVLSFFSDGTALLNGVAIPVVGQTPEVSPGESRWRMEALIGLAEAAFDRTLFEFSLFQDSRLEQPTPEQAAAIGIGVNITLEKLTPASFMVRIPWDIEGFTEKFDQLIDSPRNQIRYIVDKVKAAGVFAVIAYEKRFDEEIHEMADALRGDAERQPLQEEHNIEEFNFDIGSMQIPYPGGIEHGLSDSLVTSGVFDFSRFDSLNTFA